MTLTTNFFINPPGCNLLFTAVKTWGGWNFLAVCLKSEIVKLVLKILQIRWILNRNAQERSLWTWTGEIRPFSENALHKISFHYLQHCHAPRWHCFHQITASISKPPHFEREIIFQWALSVCVLPLVAFAIFCKNRLEWLSWVAKMKKLDVNGKKMISPHEKAKSTRR